MLVDEQNRPLVPRQLDPRLLEAVKKLGTGAQVLADQGRFQEAYEQMRHAIQRSR